jgi:hypothetical protein
MPWQEYRDILYALAALPHALSGVLYATTTMPGKARSIVKKESAGGYS